MRLDRFTGLDNVNQPLDVAPGGLTQAVNFDIDRNGRLLTRQGRVKVYTGSVTASHANDGQLMVIANGYLRRVESTGAVNALCPMSGNTLAFCEAAGQLYVIGELSAVVVSGGQARPMGVALPNDVEILVGNGRLKAGRYLVSVSAVAADGRESGALPVREVDVPEGSGLTIIPSVDPGLSGRVYLSEWNGQELYYYGDGDWVSVPRLADTRNRVDPIFRQYCGPFPFGVGFMAWHDGYVWAALGDTLYRSPPLDYEICDYRHTIKLESPITALISTVGGLFVSTRHWLYWVPQGDPWQYQFIKRLELPCIEGSATVVDMNRVGQGGGGRGVLFATREGICLCSPDGQVTQLTRRKVAFADRQAGSSAAYGDRWLLVLS